MTTPELRYSVVTPVRDEDENVSRLADALATQTRRPDVWLVVDNGSGDGTIEIVQSLASHHTWIRLLEVPGGEGIARGAPIVRAFHAGLDALRPLPDVVVKLDADVSFESDYFERQLAAFATDDRLGISSGSCWELEPDGEWHERFLTGNGVWGAARAYRRECLEEVLPLDEGMGWDGLDAIRAGVRGWTTRTLFDLPFRHHRIEGVRDGGRAGQWARLGRGSWYMGYRPSYLVARAAFRTTREPAAAALVWGYVRAAIGREPRCADVEAVEALRREQRLRYLFRRSREARGRPVGVR